jgi:hypothetical protein
VCDDWRLEQVAYDFGLVGAGESRIDARAQLFMVQS